MQFNFNSSRRFCVIHSLGNFITIIVANRFIHNHSQNYYILKAATNKIRAQIEMSYSLVRKRVNLPVLRQFESILAVLFLQLLFYLDTRRMT